MIFYRVQDKSWSVESKVKNDNSCKGHCVFLGNFAASKHWSPISLVFWKIINWSSYSNENGNIKEEKVEERNDAGEEESCPVGVVVDVGRVVAEQGESEV